jgi:hypothetical protein
VVSFKPRPLYPPGKSAVTHWIGGWVGPRAGMDTLTKSKIPNPCRESRPDRPARSLVAIPIELSQLTADTVIKNHHYYHHHRRLSRIRPLGLFRFRIYFLKLMNLFKHLVGLLGRGIGPTQGLYIHTGQHNTEKRGHTSMPRVGFEPTIPVLERPKIVGVSDR